MPYEFAGNAAVTAVEKWWLGVQNQRDRLELVEFGAGLTADEFSSAPSPEELATIRRQSDLHLVEIELYIEALWRFRKAVLFAIHHVPAAAGLVADLEGFDRSVPGLEPLHDLTSGFDHYQAGGGRFRRSPEMSMSVGIGTASITWQSFTIDVRKATIAAGRLYASAHEVLSRLRSP